VPGLESFRYSQGELKNGKDRRKMQHLLELKLRLEGDVDILLIRRMVHE